MSGPSYQQSRRVYKGVRFDVHAVELAGRNGSTVQRDAVVTPDSAVILPLLDSDTVVLIRNQRFVVGRTLWELPAGTIEGDEPPLRCAQRELAEEAGYEAAGWRLLFTLHPSPGVLTEHMHVFQAGELTHVGQQLDENERITVEPTGWEQAMAMVRDGRICDGKSIAALLFHETFGRESR